MSPIDVDVLAQAMTQAATNIPGIYAEAVAVAREYEGILEARVVTPAAFDWNAVSGELDALCEAIDEERPEVTVEVYPMLTGEFVISVLANLWDRGYRVVHR